MMTAKDIKMTSDNLSCSVCYQLFRNSKYLPCHHSYCEQCLEKMQVQSKIISPECRKEAIASPREMKVHESCEVEGTVEVLCDECCRKETAVTCCSNCAIFLCHLCNVCHKCSIQSNGHGIVPTNENSSTTCQTKRKTMKCREHDIELLFYCETCDQLVCSHCTVKDHNGHNYDTVKKMAGKHRPDLKKITATVEEMIRGLSDTHDNIEKMRKEIRQQGDEVNKKIDQRYDEVIQKLMEQKEQLKQQVHDTVSQKIKAVSTQLEEVEYAQAQAEVLNMKELNDAVEKSSDQKILSVKKRVIDCMQQITDKCKKVNLPPVQQATVEFIPTKMPFPQFGSLCSVCPYNCEITDIPKYSIREKKIEFTIITKLNNGDIFPRGGSQVRIQLREINNTVQIRDSNDGSYMASFVPQQVGEVKVSVFVNGEHIKGSPYSVMVRDYASVHNCKPSKILNNDGGMGEPWGIAFGKSGMWAVADCSNHCVYIFDGEDQLVRKFGCKGSGNGQFNHPTGVAFDSDNHLYVAEKWNHRVQKFTIDGNCLLQFGGYGSRNGKLKSPRGLIVQKGKVYIADSDNKRVSVFQNDGEFHLTIGSGQLGTPSDVTVNSNNQLLISNHAHHCIYVFTLDGDYVQKFGATETQKGQISNAYGVAVDLYGFTFVSDILNHHVLIFDEDGKCINSFGSEGSSIGQFESPFGIGISSNGIIYVCDRYNKRVQIFSY